MMVRGMAPVSVEMGGPWTQTPEVVWAEGYCEKVEATQAFLKSFFSKWRD